MKEIIHFSHANGFPAGSYRQMFCALAERYDVRAIELLAHNKSFPVTDNWDCLVQELIHHLEQNYSSPVVAVGHSFGGLLNLMAAAQRPDLIKALILLDAPVFSALETRFIALAKRWRLIDYLTPAARTNGRKAQWGSRQEALNYFRGKTLMKNFDQSCLADYVDAGTVADTDGLRLKFRPATEMKIYRTVPHNLHQIPAPISTPATVIAGRSSRILRRRHTAYMKRHLGMHVCWTDGSHMFPFEDPAAVAYLIDREIQQLLSAGGTFE